jgi:Zn-dependent oligopeptidase
VWLQKNLIRRSILKRWNRLIIDRQLLFGIVDLKYYSITNFENPINLQEIWYETEREVFGLDASVKTSPYASFDHIVEGYDAGIKYDINLRYNNKMIWRSKHTFMHLKAYTIL